MRHRVPEFAPQRSLYGVVSIVAFIVVLILVVTSLVLARDAQRDGTRGFSPVVIRGGGFITGLEVQGDTMYARTDVGGAYRYDREAQRWVQLITTSSVTSDRRPTDYQVEGLGAAPSNPSVVYLLVGSTSGESPGSRVLRSSDGGKSWTICSTNWYVGGNDSWRQSGSRIAVDPSDPRTLYVGTRRDGLQVSRDGGDTWQTIIPPTVSDSSSATYSIGVTSVVIDPSSALENGRHAVVWAGVAGVGLMRSTDAGLTWITASDFRDGFVSDMALMSRGSVAASFYGLGDVSRSFIRRVGAQGDVVDITPPSDGRWLTVATDPTTPGTLIVAPASIQKGIGVFTTRNAEAPVPDWIATSTKIADGADGTTWPTNSDLFDYMSTGQIRYFNGDFWFAEGMGMWRAGRALSDSLKWYFSSDGIEELVGNSVFKPANGALLTAQWDRGLMRHPDPSDREPRPEDAAGFPYTSRFGTAWDISASPTNPDFLVAVLDDYQDLSGRTVPERRASAFSTDAGATWKRFVSLSNGTAPTDLLFGNIAVSANDDTNIVWVPSNATGAGTKIYYSRDSGASWLSSQLNGLAPEQFLHPFYVQARKILVADPGEQGVFYALGSDSAGLAIVWKSTDSGATWNISWRSAPAEPDSSGFKFDSTLIAVGEYLIAAPGPNGGCLYRSRDRIQWEQVCSIHDAMGMGVGAPVEDSGHQVLYTYGSVDDQVGIYQSTDFGDSWHRLSASPNGIYLGVRAVAGDPGVAGRVYVALAGGGFLVGQF